MITALTITLVILTPVLAIALTGLFILRRDYARLRENYQDVNRRLNSEIKKRIDLERQLDVDNQDLLERVRDELIKAGEM